MGFGDQLARKIFRFNTGSQVLVGVTSPYVIAPADDQFKVCDPADLTKCIRLDAGAVATATTRVMTFPDNDLNMNTGAGGKRNVLASSGNTTMTSAMSGSIMLMDGSAVSYALPAVATADIGMHFTFFWTAATTGNGVITAAAGDLLVGFAAMGVSGANDVDYYFPNGSSHLVLTANGTTTGGIAGSWARFVAINATMWGVEAHLKSSGTQATPFS